MLSKKMKDSKEKDKKLIIMENKIKHLQKENITLKEKTKTSMDIELSKALEKINQLKSK